MNILGNFETLIPNIYTPISYSEDGKFMKPGRRTLRLELNNDSRLRIAAYVVKNSFWSKCNLIEKLFLKLRFVKLEPNSSVYLNINSLRSRLHLSKKEILNASTKGSLKDFITEKAQIQTSVLNEYEGIQRAYPSPEKIAAETGIKNETLMKLIQIGVSSIYPKSTTDVRDATLLTIQDLEKPPKNEKTPPLKTHTIVVKRQNNAADRPPHFEFFVKTSKELGKGSFGTVSESFQIKSKACLIKPILFQDKESMAIKEAQDVDDPLFAQSELENEYRMLKYLHSLNPNKSKPLVGIQAEPHTFVGAPPVNHHPSSPNSLSKHFDFFLRRKKTSAPQETLPSKFLYLGKKYDGDLNVSKEASIEVKLKQGREILTGLKFLASHHIVHKDLKPANILVKQNEDGTFLTHISDLAGARLLKDLVISPEKGLFNFGAHTYFYTSKQHLLAAEKAWNEENGPLCVQYHLENDVFACALLLYVHFTGYYPPCNRDSEEYILNISINDDFFRVLEIKGVPLDFQYLLRDILSSKPGETLTAAAALARYEAAMRNLPLS